MAALVLGAAAPAAPPPSFCGPTQCEGGCGNTVTVYFDDYSYTTDPADYTDPAPGCWSYERLAPSDNYATQCRLIQGVFKINAGGPNLYFDDTHANDGTVQTDVNTCANYGVNHYGSGHFFAEYMSPGPWTPVSPSQGVSHFMAELYSSDAGDVDSYWTNGDWNPSTSTYAGTIKLTPLLKKVTGTGGADPSPSNFNSIVTYVYNLCEATASAHPGGNGVLSVYTDPNYPLAGTTSGDPNSGEEAVIKGLDNCLG
ncbi:MAG TPA: hypothetical protein VFB39_13435 [Solirubrobacteraceae bacterium]|nr:hypothetical protein [Solirubrobacteraceae bacterium]